MGRPQGLSLPMLKYRGRTHRNVIELPRREAWHQYGYVSEISAGFPERSSWYEGPRSPQRATCVQMLSPTTIIAKKTSRARVFESSLGYPLSTLVLCNV